MSLILALDDEPTILNLYQSILEPAGYQLVLATDALEALRALRRQPFDLFIQDYHRPGMDGKEMIAALKADPQLKDIPILLITAGRRKPYLPELPILGLDWDHDLQGYLQKPFNAGELLDAIETVFLKCGKPLPPASLRHAARQRWTADPGIIV